MATVSREGAAYVHLFFEMPFRVATHVAAVARMRLDQSAFRGLTAPVRLAPAFNLRAVVFLLLDFRVAIQEMNRGAPARRVARAVLNKELRARKSLKRT